MRRFPRSDSRQVLRFPEDTSTGAVPLQEAKWSLVGNRVTSVTSPITVPVLTGPKAEDLGEAGTRGSDGRGQLFPGLAELGIQASQVLQELAGQLVARG